MRRVTIVYNEPEVSRYDHCGEIKAVLGVLESLDAVHQSLLELGDRVERLPLASPWAEARKKLATLDADIVFNLFEGFCGQPESEALVPEFLARAGVPFTGCPAETLRLALDKAGFKEILKAAGVRTPDFQTLLPETLAQFHLRFPCIIKPSGEDASHGISGDSFVRDMTALERQVRAVTEAYGGRALVEEFAGGREFNATVLADSCFAVLPPSEIVYSLPPDLPHVLTFAAKWEPDSPEFNGTRAVCPAEVDELMAVRIAAMARSAFHLALPGDGRGYGRVDMRLDAAGELNVIEVNPNPDISPGTGAARQALASGMTYTEFVEKIVDLALEREPYACRDPADARRRQDRPDGHIKDHARV
jgi:D-alanine-D-alanine ligase